MHMGREYELWHYTRRQIRLRCIVVIDARQGSTYYTWPDDTFDWLDAERIGGVIGFVLKYVVNKFRFRGSQENLNTKKMMR